MFFNRRKKKEKELIDQFGKMKDTEFDFEYIEKYHLGKSESDCFQHLSDDIWIDLDMDLFFAYADRTTSKIGQQYLYHKFRCIDKDRDYEIQERVISELKTNPEELNKSLYWLNKLSHHNSYHLPNLFNGKHISLPRYFFLIPFLSASALLIIILSFVNPNFFILFLGLFPIHAIIHYTNKKNVNTYIYSIPLLLTLNKVAKELSRLTLFKNLSRDISTSIHSIDKIKKRIAVFKLEQKIESDLEVIYWFFLELIKITFLLEPLLLFSVIDHIKKDKKEIENVFEFVGNIDMIISIYGLREHITNYCKPQFSSSELSICFKYLTHPLIKDCVTNSLETSKSCLITGSNMSGKTTFIRAIGISYISGLVLNTCFAEQFNVSLAEINSVIRITDDITTSSSYFLKEVDSMKNIIKKCDNGSFQIVLLDELFKGTNTKERIANSKAILSFLQKRNCLVFVSTHDLELTDLLKDEFKLFFFSETIDNDHLSFNYKLQSGTLKVGNATKILDHFDYPIEIISEAKQILHTSF
ncbi:MAG: DNA mismatch repair protein MutS [Flavobacteriales bacterium]|nr:DNA mismatch repair protein MutS [Flavobacteriales bacterium]